MKRNLSVAFLALITLVLTGRAQNHGHGTRTTTQASLPMQGAQPVTNLSMFVWELQIPSNAVPTGVVSQYGPLVQGIPIGTNTNTLVYEIRMRTNLHQFHPDLPAVPVWGYSDSPDRLGSSPGPTIQATNGMPLYVRWINELPDTYPDWIPAATVNHGVTNSDVYNVVHLHGGATRPAFDGHPTHRFRPGVTTNYYYDNIDLSAEGDGETLWYHDHALGLTANNVYAGLAGLYLLRNPGFEQSLQLPSGAYEIPLAFQDRDIQTNVPPATLLSDLASTNVHAWHHLPVVNGRVAPFLKVEPRRYRFRMLNGCSFRTIGLALVSDRPGPEGNPNVPMYQIGTEDGFLPNTVRIQRNDSKALPALRLMPGERADVIIDFTQWTNAHIVVTNDFSAGSNAAPPKEPINVMGGAFLQFQVTSPLSGTDTSKLPMTIHTNFVTAQQLASSNVVTTRRITLDFAIEKPFPGLKFSQNTNLFAILNMMDFDERVTETPRAGDVEIWEFINLTQASHPMHVHLLDFLVLQRRSFLGFTNDLSIVPAGVSNFISDRLLRGRPKDLTNYLDMSPQGVRFVQSNELGPKDVVHAAPGAVTSIVMRWPTNEVFFGPYVYHCHILDHEDNDMMRPFELRAPLPKHALFTEYDPLKGAVSIQLGTVAGMTHEVQASSDLFTWEPISRAVGTGLTLYLDDPAAYRNTSSAGNIGAPHRFYRAIASP